MIIFTNKNDLSDSFVVTFCSLITLNNRYKEERWKIILQQQEMVIS